MIRFLAVTALAALVVSSPASSAEFGTKPEAVAMVKRVQAQFKKDGAEATFKAVTDKTNKAYQDRDLYAFIYHANGPQMGVNVAHGARPALIGKNLIGLKDQDGKYLVKDLIDIANKSGSGWFDYKWPNPLNNKIEDKTSYVEKMGDYMVGVGVYRP